MRALGYSSGLLVAAGLLFAMGFLAAGCGSSTEPDIAMFDEMLEEPEGTLSLLSIAGGAYTRKEYNEARATVRRADARRKKKQRSEARRLYLQALPTLRSFAQEEKTKKGAAYALSRAEHGLGALCLAEKKYAAAHGHYRNSAFYYEYGGLDDKWLSSSAGRAEEMERRLKKAGRPVPEWESPLPAGEALVGEAPVGDALVEEAFGGEAPAEEGYTERDFRQAKATIKKADGLRKAKRRDEALKLYLPALPVLRHFARKKETKKGAALALAQAEHSLGAIFLVRKEYAAAYTHYRSSVFYFEYGGYKQKARLSGSAGRVEEMKRKIEESGETIPEWEPPL